jgi:hypothetical protein
VVVQLSWIIIRTDARKEHFVAAQIRDMGFQSWVPCQMIASRPGISRRVTAKAAVQIKELPILPKLLFAEMDVFDAPAIMGIRHFKEIIRDNEERIVCIPASQISRHREALEQENASTLALVAAKSRRQKARWRSLKDALLDLVDSARQKMGEAA